MRKFLVLFLMTGAAMAQTMQTYTGVIKDLSGGVVTSGQVTFTLTPSTDSTIPGTGRFVPTTISCNINVDGTLSGFVSGAVSGACLITPNISLSPTGTSYRICEQPNFATPGNCFFDYALGGTKDISSIAPTLSTGPINYGGVTGPQGENGKAGPPGGSLSYPGVTSDGAGGISSASTVVNVKAFGCTGNGTTDDSACITSAITALNALGAGVLYFPVGNYFSATCGFTLSVPTIVRGDGVNDRTVATFGSTVVCGSTTANLFTHTATSGAFENITLVNTAATTPTAGTAVLTSSTNPHARINFTNVWVLGFYDDVHIQVGESWLMTGCMFFNPVRYGLIVENTLLPDAGDWQAIGNDFLAGPITQVASAGFYQTSSGGGKFYSNKVNSEGGGNNFQHGLLLNLNGSVQGQYSLNNIETTTAEPIYIQHAWSRLTFSDNMLIAPNGFSGIFSADALNIAYIGGGTIDSLGNAPYAVNLSIGGQNIMLMPFGTNQASWTTGLTNITTNTSVSNFNNTNLNTQDFNGDSVTANTGTFNSGVVIGTPTTGGSVNLTGLASSSGANWHCSTAGGLGVQCLSSGGAEFDLFDNSMVNSGHGPYAIGGVAGFTGTKTAGTCVMTFNGGLVMNVTGC